MPGRRLPKLTAVVAMAAVLGVSVAWLYKEMEEADARVGRLLVAQNSVVSIRNRLNRATATALSETFAGTREDRYDVASDHLLAREELERLRADPELGPRLASLANRLVEPIATRQAMEREILSLGAAGKAGDAAGVLASARWTEARATVHDVLEELIAESAQEARRLDQAHAILLRTMAAAIGVLVLFLLSTLVLSVLLSRRERREREESAARLAEAHAEAQRSEALLRAITDSAPDPIFARDLSGRMTFANAVARREVGPGDGEYLGLTAAEFTGDEAVGLRLAESDRKVMESGTAMTFEEVVSGRRGTRVYLTTKAPFRDAAGRVAGIVGVAKDVSELREAQQRLAVASRLSAVGTLVAGVAHEVNNPLAGAISSHGFAVDEVVALLGLLRSPAPPEPPEVARRLGQVLEALSDSQVGQRRVAAIVKDLVAFGRAGATREPTRLRDVVEGARRWVPAPCAGRIRIEVDDQDASDVMASPGQLQQVLLDLVSNACKAIPPERIGRVIIRLLPGPPGFSRIEVVDDGVGMTPEVLGRIFDPFFTTRDIGQGMGLGLSISHSIVERFGGALTATSTPGAGTVMRIDLPVAA